MQKPKQWCKGLEVSDLIYYNLSRGCCTKGTLKFELFTTYRLLFVEIERFLFWVSSIFCESIKLEDYETLPSPPNRLESLCKSY